MRPPNPTRLCCLVVPLLAPVAFAGDVNELENNGFASNNSRASAQNIAAASFTANNSPNVFGTLPTASVRGRLGGDDVDFFSFSTAGGLAYFSTTNTSNVDTYIALFRSDGTLLGDNDDAQHLGGSPFDSFLGSFNLGAGSYFIAITSGKNSANASFSGSIFNELMRPDSGFGGFAFGDATLGDDSFARSGVQIGDGEYTLNITIPSPGSLAALSIAGLLAARRRRD
jgi:hypothetical protein